MIAIKNPFFLLFCGVLLFASKEVHSQKTYQKVYFENGNIKEEGWLKDDVKFDYWKTYYENAKLKSEGRYKNGKKDKYWYFYNEDGTKKSEGHFKADRKSKWWLFYDDMNQIDHKCQLKNGQKNGYCLHYKNEKLIRAEKYKLGKKIKEWTDFRSFRKENKLSDLQ